MKTGILATELRIGNILHEFGIETKVDSRMLMKIESANERNKIIIGLTPIPLSESILFRFGFKKHEHYSYPYMELYQEIDGLDEYQFSFDLKNQKFGIYINNTRDVRYWINCEYVHQLQNLHFALTGVELIIKDE